MGLVVVSTGIPCGSYTGTPCSGFYFAQADQVPFMSLLLCSFVVMISRAVLCGCCCAVVVFLQVWVPWGSSFYDRFSAVLPPEMLSGAIVGILLVFSSTRWSNRYQAAELFEVFAEPYEAGTFDGLSD